MRFPRSVSVIVAAAAIAAGCGGARELETSEGLQVNCTFCHGTATEEWTGSDLALAAPPRGVHGETLTSQRAVGAHQKHLGNGSAISDGVPCSECHVVPTTTAHLDGSSTPTFGTLARQQDLTPNYAGGTCSSTYCHGATLAGGSNPTPSWTGSAPCGSCHGSPPATGQHMRSNHASQTCSRCHAQVATNTTTPGILADSTARSLHVNGQKDVALSVSGTWDPVAKTCTNVACHGSGSTSFSW